MTDWIKLLGTVAPAVATAVNGPLAGIAVGLIAKKLGVTNDVKSVQEAVLSSTPETLLKLKEADNEFVTEMKKLDVDLEKIHGLDRQSARDLAKISMKPQVFLSVIYSAGYFLVLYQFVTSSVVIPAESEAVFNLIMGALTAAQTQILNFWIGSSSGSKEKDVLRVN